MPEGLSDGETPVSESHLTFVVQAISPDHDSETTDFMPTPSNVTDLFPEAPTQVASPSVCRFGATIALSLPGEAIRHPRLPDQIRRELGRICAVDLQHEGIRVGFGARGSSYDEAAEDCDAVVERLVGWLGLGHEAVVEHSVFERDLGLLALIERGTDPTPDLL